jgi:hypothetical protein
MFKQNFVSSSINVAVALHLSFSAISFILQSASYFFKNIQKLGSTSAVPNKLEDSQIATTGRIR